MWARSAPAGDRAIKAALGNVANSRSLAPPSMTFPTVAAGATAAGTFGRPGTGHDVAADRATTNSAPAESRSAGTGIPSS
jgi:hypothetical protein